ncbi:MAG TPA: hypothetical protein VNI02_13480, partial [Blastocatellia bacterium]|nr:hypothetical protein [Blastocatellia bacterium]
RPRRATRSRARRSGNRTAGRLDVLISSSPAHQMWATGRTLQAAGSKRGRPLTCLSPARPARGSGDLSPGNFAAAAEQ